MQVKCEYCDNYIDATAEQCEFCGAPNINKVRAANKIPRTIEELQAFCAQHNLNLEAMHFHIGEDYRGPRAFGIYEHGGQFTVYKNKSDGTRAVRYEGTDEAYAVNEIYQKMKAEMNEVRAADAARGAGKSSGKASGKGSGFRSRWADISGKISSVLAILVLVCPFVAGLAFCVNDAFDESPSHGYYVDGDDVYYYGSSGWYEYDGVEWGPGVAPDGVLDDPDSYWQSYSYEEDFGVPSFSSSDYWDIDNNWDDDWDDDDWDWDSDWDDDDDDWDSWSDWDSGYDWDSDW